jgi:hypothetical protein
METPSPDSNGILFLAPEAAGFSEEKIKWIAGNSSKIKLFRWLLQ